ncbi:MAG: hypothetical protein M3421_13590 [Bacteroidota bacterium]|nr:hypothetical protein [Bacteroidota bacterium]
MQIFPDNEFDNWIKNSIEDPQIPFDPAAWEQMEIKLRPVVFPAWSSFLNSFSIITSTCIIMYMLFIQTNEVHSLASKEFTDNTEEIEVTEHNYDGLPNNFVENNTETLEGTSVTTYASPVNPEIVSNDKIKKPKKPTETKINLNNSKKLLSTNESNFQELLSPDEPKETHPLDEHNLNNSNNQVYLINKKDLIIEENYKEKFLVPVLKHRNEEISDIKQVKQKGQKFNISILLSPDFSSVKLRNINGTGLNTGVSFEYSLSKRWRISTGIISSRKIYDVQNEQGGYSNPSPNGLESINASCGIIDIPLNIRYNIFYSEKGSAFLSSGLSTYLMLREDYQFNYNTYYNKYSEEVSIKRENNHYFQILNFSLGYEKHLNKRLSLQGEPFLKVPLKEVGYGKIKLISMGAFISLKYRF